MTDISNSNDTIDIRDLIKRFEELEGELEKLQDAFKDAEEREPEEGEDLEELMEAKKEAAEALADFDSDEGDEYKTLKELLEELAGAGGDEKWRGDWYPGSLIRDSYFEDAMRELLVDIGDLPKNIPDYIEIDWEKTVRNLQGDYSSVEYDGVTYWYR